MAVDRIAPSRHTLHDKPRHLLLTCLAQRALADPFTGLYGRSANGDTLTAVGYEPAMPARRTLNVASTEPLVRYVRDQVATGRHETASDVVRVALQALIQRDGAVNAPPADAPAGRLDHG